ncbi:MAG: acyl-CoA thioesterase [Xanthomonadaceae bacterium]|nr:acyl-CoA thioesterase [Xanthomonadaceae bacterium]
MSQHFRYYLRVRYSECDAQKVVFNARYGEYVDLASTAFLRAIGLDELLGSGQFDYQVVRQVLEWKAPARFDDVLELTVYATHLGNTSFTLMTEFRHAGKDAITATADTVYVAVDPQTLTKTPLTDQVRAALQRGGPGLVVDHAGYFPIRLQEG